MPGEGVGARREDTVGLRKGQGEGEGEDHLLFAEAHGGRRESWQDDVPQMFPQALEDKQFLW